MQCDECGKLDHYPVDQTRRRHPAKVGITRVQKKQKALWRTSCIIKKQIRHDKAKEREGDFTERPSEESPTPSAQMVEQWLMETWVKVRYNMYRSDGGEGEKSGSENKPRWMGCWIVETWWWGGTTCTEFTVEL